MNALQARQQIQQLLHVAEDGLIGAKTLAALQLLTETADDAPWPASPASAAADVVHFVLASSFADPADVAAFRTCKSAGGSDVHCFAEGDNGVGKWGDDCSQGSGPKCALPPEMWVARYGSGSGARHAKVSVTIGGITVVCVMDDTMPHLANIRNGAGIDLNPDAVAAFGLTAPLMIAATWQWADGEGSQA